MEKTITAAAPAAAPAERFYFHDSAVGKSFAIREANDQQLARLRESVEAQHTQFLQKMGELTNALIQSGAMLATVTYELERRVRSIAIAHSLPH